MCTVLAVIAPGVRGSRRVDGLQLEEEDGWEGRERGREEEGASMSTTGNDDERAPPVVLAAPRLSAVPTRRRGPVYPLTPLLRHTHSGAPGQQPRWQTRQRRRRSRSVRLQAGRKCSSSPRAGVSRRRPSSPRVPAGARCPRRPARSACTLPRRTAARAVSAVPSVDARAPVEASVPPGCDTDDAMRAVGSRGSAAGVRWCRCPLDARGWENEPTPAESACRRSGRTRPGLV